MASHDAKSLSPTEKMDERRTKVVLACIGCSLIRNAIGNARRRRRKRFRMLLLRRQRRVRFAVATYLFFRMQNRANQRVMWAFPRPQLWFETLLNDPTGELDGEWRGNFWVHKRTFQAICDKIGPEIAKEDTRMRDAVPVPKRIAIALWRFATGDTFRSCGLQFGCGKSTAIVIADQVCRALIRLSPSIIRFPSTRNEYQEKMNAFEEIAGFPQVVGAVDDTHIALKGPTNDREDYFNRKQFYSVVGQAVADADGKFLDVSVGYPGSMHDSRIFRYSMLSERVERGEILVAPTRRIGGCDFSPLLLGDAAYALSKTLIKPYPDNAVIAAPERAFNRAHCKTRVKVEQAYGELQARWRCLNKRLDKRPRKASRTFVACCVLHNMCVEMGDRIEDVAPFRRRVPRPPPPVGRPNDEGRRVRNAIRDVL